jgi:uncharacterized protein YecT (DUF1311 family)
MFSRARTACVIVFITILLAPIQLKADQMPDGCLKTATQAQLNECADKEATNADAQLKKTYSALLKAAANDANEPGAVAKIQSQERVWTLYRKAYLDAMFPAQDKQMFYGSSFPMRANLIWAWLTRQHVHELQRILNAYTNP